MADVFEGRRAVITGAGSGLGRAMALHFAHRGCHLALCDIRDEGLQDTALEAKALGVRVQTSVVDVADAQAMASFAEQTIADGPVHILVNNAGVALGGRLVDTSPEDWRWLIDINVLGVVHGLHAFLPSMLAHDGPAHVVNVSSAAGFTGMPGLAAYCASKAAVLSISEALAAEHAHEGLHVHALCPGFVKTSIGESARIASGDQNLDRDKINSMTSPPGRKVDDVAKAVVRAIDRRRFLVVLYPESHALRLLRSLPTPLATRVRNRIAVRLFAKVKG
ncbi:MAG: NAD(P)-dependent dehydrogenase (short-subunit alcohol dehydrogenase family) [Kiritimatiellia bacterium]|jgi:NAD(P)-dependent dehydrogenase (short-subunit alcohol dehydrogenase family)